MLPDINFFHLTLPVVLLFVGDWMTPTPSHRAHPFRRGERGITVYLYPESILLLLRYLIWSSFQYLVLTYILVTYFSTHACLAWNQLSSSYPTSYIAVAWRLDDAHPFPGPTHSTGGRGDDGLWPWHTMTMTMAGGVGGGPGTWNIYNIYYMCRLSFEIIGDHEITIIENQTWANVFFNLSCETLTAAHTFYSILMPVKVVRSQAVQSVDIPVVCRNSSCFLSNQMHITRLCSLQGENFGSLHQDQQNLSGWHWQWYVIFRKVYLWCSSIYMTE